MIYRFSDYELDTDQRELRHAGVPSKISAQLFDLLAFLVANPQRVLTKDDLNQAVWKGRVVSESVVSSRISSLREVIGDDGRAQRLIKTVHGTGFRFIGDVVREDDRAAEASAATSTAGGSREARSTARNSIAVLAFDNLSNDPDQDHFADGLSEDITTILAKIQGLFVPARNLSFRYRGRPVDVREVGADLGVSYVLEGSVRRSGHQIRVTAQLIDVATGSHVWAERFDRELVDVFEVQDHITREIVSALQIELTTGDAARVFAAQTTDFEAWECVIRARHLISTNQAEHALKAKRLLEEAIERDDEYVHAHYLLGLQHAIEVFNGWSEVEDDAMAVAWARADRARALDPEDALAENLTAYLRLIDGRHAEALACAESSCLRAPNNLFVSTIAAQVEMFMGKADAATSRLESIARTNPSYPLPVPGTLGWTRFFSGDLARAVEWSEEALSLHASYDVALICLACVELERGRHDVGRAFMARALNASPRLSAGRYPLTRFFADADQNARNRERLIQAGMPA